MYSYSTVPSCVFYLPTYSPINLCMCSLRVVLNPFSILDDATSRVHPGGLHNRVGWVGRILRALDFCYLVAPQTHILWTLCWLVVQIIHDLWPAKNTPRRPHRTPHSTKKKRFESTHRWCVVVFSLNAAPSCAPGTWREVVLDQRRADTWDCESTCRVFKTTITKWGWVSTRFS